MRSPSPSLLVCLISPSDLLQRFSLISKLYDSAIAIIERRRVWCVYLESVCGSWSICRLAGAHRGVPCRLTGCFVRRTIGKASEFAPQFFSNSEGEALSRWSTKVRFGEGVASLRVGGSVGEAFSIVPDVFERLL